MAGDYYETAAGVRITRARAVRELRRHGVPDREIGAFFADCGDCDHYDAQAVLGWLGY